MQIVIGGLRLYFPCLNKQSPLLMSHLCSPPYPTLTYLSLPFPAPFSHPIQQCLVRGGCRQCVQFSLEFPAQSNQSFYAPHCSAHVLISELYLPNPLVLLDLTAEFWRGYLSLLLKTPSFGLRRGLFLGFLPPVFFSILSWLLLNCSATKFCCALGLHSAPLCLYSFPT